MAKVISEIDYIQFQFTNIAGELKAVEVPKKYAEKYLKEKAREKLEDWPDLAERINVTHANYTGFEVIELLTDFAEKEKKDRKDDEIPVCPKCGCNKFAVVDDENWCLNVNCRHEWINQKFKDDEQS